MAANGRYGTRSDGSFISPPRASPCRGTKQLYPRNAGAFQVVRRKLRSHHALLGCREIHKWGRTTSGAGRKTKARQRENFAAGLLQNGNVLLLSLRRRLLLLGQSAFAGSAYVRTGLLIASQERHERRDFKRHLLASGKQRNGLGLQQFHVVGPRIELDASAERKSGDLIELVGLQLRRRADQLGVTTIRVAQVRIDQSRKRFFDSASSCFRKSPALPSLSL